MNGREFDYIVEECFILKRVEEGLFVTTNEKLVNMFGREFSVYLENDKLDKIVYSYEDLLYVITNVLFNSNQIIYDVITNHILKLRENYKLKMFLEL